jgi:hypothetical protein
MDSASKYLDRHPVRPIAAPPQRTLALKQRAQRAVGQTRNLQVGCPIRRSRDQRVLSPPPGLSQSATSFIASCRQGIHQTPFSRLIRSGEGGSVLGLACRPLACSRPTDRPSGDPSPDPPHRSLAGAPPSAGHAAGLGQCIRFGKTAPGGPVARSARYLGTNPAIARSARRPRLRPHWPEPPKASRVLSLHDVKAVGDQSPQ